MQKWLLSMPIGVSAMERVRHGQFAPLALADQMLADARLFTPPGRPDPECAEQRPIILDALQVIGIIQSYEKENVPHQ
ncbi:hypothetical protein [Sphingomonas sp. SCN 67-18]|uniref:hypothetical protein n=1 Tax=uncultured Sphingomonas sp. TaxID=158754 RepID=UPI0025FC57B1|nr:hypothetical protein [Sphingomonas sp. SCN 67-18]